MKTGKRTSKTPSSFLARVQGVANFAPPDCQTCPDLSEITWILEQTLAQCAFKAVPFQTGCAWLDFALTYAPTIDNWRLLITNGAGGIFFDMSGEDFDCFGTNVFEADPDNITGTTICDLSGITVTLIGQE